MLDEGIDIPKAKKTKLSMNVERIAGKKREKKKVEKESAKVVKKKATDDCIITNTVGVGRTEYPNFRYYQVNENWQLQTCGRLGLTFSQKFACQCGGPDTVLTRPDLRTLFRAISYIITDSEQHHSRLPDTLVGYMLSISHLLVGLGPDGQRNYVDTLTSTNHMHITHYLQSTAMDRNGTWGSAIEIACLSHMLNAPIYVYDISHEVSRYIAYFPCTIERSLSNDINCMSLYIYFTGNHFNVITSVRRV